MKFTEEKLEQTFIELLGNEGFPHRSGDNIFRSDDEVLIENDLKNFLLSKIGKWGHYVASLVML